MQLFLSHNSADKADARLLGSSLIERGIGVWLDEWAIRPGESIATGIESGLDTSQVLCLLWSAAAARSNWVGAEINAYLHRRMQDASLRIVPVMIEETPLPRLVADYRGFRINDPGDYQRVADELAGSPRDEEVAKLLQRRLWDLAKGRVPEGSPHRYIVCPRCGSTNLKHMKFEHDFDPKMVYGVMCLEDGCKFMQVEGLPL